MALIKVKDGYSDYLYADPNTSVRTWPNRPRWYTKLFLHKTHSGKYWQQCTSDSFYTKFLSPKEATIWLLDGGYTIPKDLMLQMKALVEI